MTAIPAARAAAQLRAALDQAGWLQQELARQQRGGNAPDWLREALELLDALESGLCWDLRDELARSPLLGAKAARRLSRWLRPDMDGLAALLDRLAATHEPDAARRVAADGCAALLARLAELEAGLRAAPPRWPPRRRRARPPLRRPSAGAAAVC